MVRSAKDWPWSSYRQTSGMNNKNDWLTTEWQLAAFSKKPITAQKKYRDFVARGKNQSSPWESLRNQVLLGSDEYVSRILDGIDQEKDLSEIPKSQRKEKPKSISLV